MKTFLPIIMCLGLFVLQPSYADEWFDMGRADSGILMDSRFSDNGSISSDEAARIVQSRSGGKVLRVTDMGSSFLVKVLLPKGVVKTFTVDKSTGSVN